MTTELTRTPGKTSAETPSIKSDSGGCHHFWMIESPNGSQSHGVCKYCNEEKDFDNLIYRYAPKGRRWGNGPVKYRGLIRPMNSVYGLPTR
jgi:hypothetical protein